MLKYFIPYYGMYKFLDKYGDIDEKNYVPVVIVTLAEIAYNVAFTILMLSLILN